MTTIPLSPDRVLCITSERKEIDQRQELDMVVHIASRMTTATKYPSLDKQQRETQYPYDDSTCSSQAHFMNSTMVPWHGKRNIDGLSTNYTEYLYEYAPRPTCGFDKRDQCNSKYLFCDISNGDPHCAAKIKIGGYCDQYIYVVLSVLFQPHSKIAEDISIGVFLYVKNKYDTKMSTLHDIDSSTFTHDTIFWLQ
ncbi:hypothetical protein Y032_0002g927 [Ancylostoma ceylanicum]|uniref:Uncharacterized protein n=1 Tax=Ancylostoma ceylanicum TaxID=53326 RepID=A0A016W204_9BILA|nr:hypothetical protein Y032_0002g927 [Ancylostoma ceylanicum]